MRLADGYDPLLFDLDGVLFRGPEVVPGGPETLEALRRAGHRLAFITNNSARTPEAVARMLRELGYAADPSEVVTSALAAAELVAARGYHRAYVVGEEGIRRALAGAGIEVLDGEPERADCVVVGWDREVTYAKLRRACLLVQRGAALVATNDDRAYPAPDGLWPGAGALLAVVTTTTGAVPEVVGKPHPPLFEAAVRRVGDGRPLVVGDRLETDIAGANALGWDSVLVLSGVTDPDRAAAGDVRPTYVVRDVRALLEPPPDRRTGQK
ncbi:MAG: acid sugar phosphatase [Actinomycetota bacterium]|nr:MAG: acid sugar phosphatase [Actinomycetota bacterium]